MTYDMHNYCKYNRSHVHATCHLCDFCLASPNRRTQGGGVERLFKVCGWIPTRGLISLSPDWHQPTISCMFQCRRSVVLSAYLKRWFKLCMFNSSMCNRLLKPAIIHSLQQHFKLKILLLKDLNYIHMCMGTECIFLQIKTLVCLEK